jgi:hypothetical protein
MFETFATALTLVPSDQTPQTGWNDDFLAPVRGYAELVEQFAGCSFDLGLYRIHDASSGPVAASAISEAFPDFARRAVPFAFDWLGRQFALDRERMVGDDPQVLLLEPGTGQVLEIPSGLVDFHDKELVDFRDAALAATFFAGWCAREPTSVPLAREQCVGYRVPLFLGGADTVDNLEVIDWEVYWSISGQLLLGTASLAPGTTIRQVSR